MEKSTEIQNSRRKISGTAMWLAIAGVVLLFPLLIWMLAAPQIPIPDPHTEHLGPLPEAGYDLLVERFPVIVALPTAAGISFLVVAYFRQVSGPVEFEAFGVKFKGRGGPAILWVVCFLSIAGAIKLLW